MLREMPSHLLTEWMAYYDIEPFGDELLDVHFSEMRSILFNANRGKNVQAVEPKKMRLWKMVEKFDPQQYFDHLKAALGFKKWD